MSGSWKDQMNRIKEQFNSFLGKYSKKQAAMMAGIFLVLVIALSAFVYFASRPEYVPLYNGELSQREIGDIKAELDAQGFSDYQLSETGTMLLVPKKEASALLVSLASAGYPKDNSINYDIFSENLSFGGTDRQYDILEREAMQNQLAGVLEQVEGIAKANVMLTLPEESVFIRSETEQASSASVVVEVEPGVQLDGEQIRALYTLVTRSVPKLTEENVTIMNQYSETLSLDDSGNAHNLDQFEKQQKVQKNIERDIQQSLQSLLGTVLGSDKVYVHTIVKMNFDKVVTQENLVEGTDGENEGIVISSEENSKSFTGEDGTAGGIVGTGETDVPGYAAADSDGESSYEENQNRVNYEVNRINNEIVKSPYEIEDISINVGVESSAGDSGIAANVQENIRNVVANTVRTALGHPEMTQEEIDQRVTVFPHAFASQAAEPEQENMNWLLIAGLAALVLAAIVIMFIWLKRRKAARIQKEIELEEASRKPKEPEYFAEQDVNVETQLKKLLQQRPEDFSKVIKSWLHEGDA